MTKEELFKKYDVGERHNVWDDGHDNWNSVEIYRVMHNGNLPDEDDLSLEYITKFLDDLDASQKLWKAISSRNSFHGLFITAKRMIYRYSSYILIPELLQS